ncbi:MAG: glycosyltransferase [Chloroflexi bacterium]|nr:glycosyltransferase [Chloroflexota bacterium]
MSDTGGGHRAAADAIIEALAYSFPDRYAVTLFDVFKQAAIAPFDLVPNWYLPFTTHAEPLWHLGFLITNNRMVERLAQPYFETIMGRGLRRYLREQTPDLVVSTHPIFNAFGRRALRSIGSKVPFVTVVTDLFDAHVLWFDRKVDFCTVPSEGARKFGIKFGMPQEKMRVVGEPVSLTFLDTGLNKADVRAKLGLAVDQKTVLLVGGGEGMGKLYDIARAIDAARLPAQLVIIAGRNQALQKKLAMVAWKIPVSVQGFVRNMPEWMRAADVIVTKAGPGTICEALACGLPILLSGFLPGQETGNVTFVEQGGAGVLRRNPADIVTTLDKWFSPGTSTLDQLAERAKELARPRAAIDIAKMLDDILMAREQETGRPIETSAVARRSLRPNWKLLRRKMVRGSSQ